MNKLLRTAQTIMSTSIKHDLALARQVIIGLDCWTKKSLTASFLAISASFFHPSRHQPIHILLNLHEIAHPHTGEMLAEKLLKTLAKWDISAPKVLAVITDNGSNMLKAIRVANNLNQIREDAEGTEEENADERDEQNNTEEENEDEEDNDEEYENEEDEENLSLSEFTRLPCIAHTLQLVIRELNKNQSYTNLLLKVKAVVRFIKISSVASEKLAKLCGKVVKKDCTTRWNAALLMVDRLLQIRGPLEEVLMDMKHDSLTNTEWARLADLKHLLAPFREQTDALQTDTLCLSSVIPALLELTLHLQSPTLPKLWANILLQSLTTRFAVFLDPKSIGFIPLPAAACYLDPTVSAVMLRDDMGNLLSAAKSYIALKVCAIADFLSYNI
jgi:hypothetical protein